MSSSKSSRFLVDIEFDLDANPADMSAETIMDLMSEEIRKMTEPVQDITTLYGMIVLMLKRGKDEAERTGTLDYSFRLKDRISTNWPSMFSNRGSMNFSFGGRQALRQNSIRFMFSVRGEPTMNKSTYFHMALQIDKLDNYRKVMRDLGCDYDKSKGLFVSVHKP